MSKTILTYLLVILTLGFMVTDVEAKRFGGGRSIGHQRSFSQQNAPHTPNASSAQRPGNKWLGPLAGLAAGGLLASLFMGHGLGSGILSWLLLAGVLYFIWRLISRLRGNLSTTKAFYQTPETGRVISQPPHFSESSFSHTPPHGFDEEAFLRQAKTTFIRLQAAYDSKNLLDIREFTAPEVFAEIQMQIQERGDAANQTDVIQIDASLVNLDLQSHTMTASVQFSGLIREEAHAEAIDIKEIWHFTQDKFRNAWLVSGIQQVN